MSAVIMVIIWISQHYWQGTQRLEAMQRPGWSGGYWTCPALLGGTFRGWSHSQEVSEGMEWLSQGRKKRDVNSQPEISRALGPTTMSSVLLLLSLRRLQDIQAVGFYCHYYYYFRLAVDKLGGWIGEKVQLCVAIVGMEAEMIVVDDLTKVRHEGGEERRTKHRALRDASVDGGLDLDDERFPVVETRRVWKQWGHRRQAGGWWGNMVWKTQSKAAEKPRRSLMILMASKRQNHPIELCICIHWLSLLPHLIKLLTVYSL